MDAPSDVGAPGAVPAPPPPPGPGPRRLRRRPDDGHVAGVCSGVAEYFDIDPLLVRIAAVVLLVSGPGFVAYVLAWIFIPAEPGQSSHGPALRRIDRKDRATQVFGIVLLGLGVSVIWGDWWSPARGWLFPLALMAVGGWLLLRPDDDEDDDREDRPSSALPPVPSVPSVPPVPWPFVPPAPTVTEAVASPAPASSTTEPGGAADAAASPLDDPAVDGDVAEDLTTELPTETAGLGGGSGAPPTAPWDVPPPPVPGPGPGAPVAPGRDRHRHRHRRHRRLLSTTVFGMMLVWAGIAWLAGVGLTTGLAVGLVIIGLGCVFGSFVGGMRALIVPALVVAAALAVSASVDIPLRGPLGQQRWSPDERIELQDAYEVSMGEGILDLSDLPVPPNEELSIRASAGLGHLVVLVAEDEPVFVNAEVGAGEIVVFGETRNGVGVDLHESFGSDGQGLILDLEVGMGQIEVRRVEPSEPRGRELG